MTKKDARDTMTDIVCEISELNERRPLSLNQILDRIAGKFVHVEPRKVQNSLGLIAGMGSENTIIAGKKTFNSNVDMVYCEYHEWWRPIDQFDQEFRLTNLQFQLLQFNESSETLEEIIAFHWHPTNQKYADDNHHRHRPHIHVTIAPYPISRSHLNVTLTADEKNNRRVKYLDDLLVCVIDLMAVEVLDPLNSSRLKSK